ncbi:MAG: HIT domain-containing protein [Planctomycetota bacterium]
MSKQNLWAPWRIGYLQELGGASPPGQAGDCFLCAASQAGLSAEQAAERLVLHRTDHAALLLNRYPYSNGHLLVSPHAHVPELSDLDATARAGLMELCELSARLLKAAVNPQGVNVGANLGRAAGAGVPGHLHFHVVPRWAGDCNFMDVVAGTRVIPQALDESYRALKDTLAKLI